MSGVKDIIQSSQFEFDLNSDGQLDLISIGLENDYRVCLKNEQGSRYTDALTPQELLPLLKSRSSELVGLMGIQAAQYLEYGVAMDGLANKIKQDTVTLGTNEQRVQNSLAKAYTRMKDYAHTSGTTIGSLKEQFSRKLYDKLPDVFRIGINPDTAVADLLEAEFSSWSPVDRGMARQIWETGQWSVAGLTDEENSFYTQAVGGMFDMSEHPVLGVVGGVAAIILPEVGVVLCYLGLGTGVLQTGAGTFDYATAASEEEKLQAKIGTAQGVMGMAFSALALTGLTFKGVPSSETAGLSLRPSAAAIPDEQLAVIPVRGALPGPAPEVPAAVPLPVISPKSGTTTIGSFSHPVAIEESAVASSPKPVLTREGPAAVDVAVDNLLNPPPADLPIPYASWGRPNPDVDILLGDTMFYKTTPIDPDARRVLGAFAGFAGFAESAETSSDDTVGQPMWLAAAGSGAGDRVFNSIFPILVTAWSLNDTDLATLRILFSTAPQQGVAELLNKFRYLSKTYHPDKQFTGNNETFIKINNAWEQIKNILEAAGYQTNAGAQARADQAWITNEITASRGGIPYAGPPPPIGPQRRNPAPANMPLKQFLLSAFSVDDLRRLIRWDTRLGVIWNSLPSGPISPAGFTDSLILELQRGNLIDGEFFNILRQERPRRIQEINQLEKEVLP